METNDMASYNLHKQNQMLLNIYIYLNFSKTNFQIVNYLVLAVHPNIFHNEDKVKSWKNCSL